MPPIGAARTEKTWPFSGQKKFGPEKIEKHVEFFSRCSFKKCVFVGNGAIFAFFRLRPLVPPPRAAHWKDLALFRPKWAKTPDKVDFPGLGGRSGRNADPVNPMWAPMSPLQPEIWGFEAGLGVISSRIVGGGSAELGRGEGLPKSQLGLPLFLIRFTELKYVVLQPVYPIIRRFGWNLRV